MKTSTKTSPLRVFAAACIVAVGFCFVAGMYAFSVSDKGAANKDFIAYWSAGQQLRHGANPYDVAEIFRMEQSIGLDGDTAILMRNPPVAFFLALPLGFVGAKSGFILWSLVLLGGLSLANWIVWNLHGSPDSRLHLLGYLFAPALACQLAGQVGTLLLIGVSLFLYLHKSWPYLAGMALLLCALKPHLILPLFLVLTLWSVYLREFRILAGFTVAVLAACALSFFLDIHAWSQYSQMIRAAHIENEFVPTLSMMFRLSLNPRAAWLQFLPEACGCIWAAWYFLTRRDRWNWMDQGLLLLIVSTMCAPYAWFSDEAMLLPAVMAGLYRAVGSGRSVLPLVLFAGVALFEVQALVKMTSPYYLWTAPAWLAWYIYATTGKRARAQGANTFEEGIIQQASR